MKKVIFSSLFALSLITAGAVEAATYGFVNFKEIVDKSKIGKQEQATFDSLKDQMEKVLEEKDKELNEIASKFNDPDFMDTLSPEAENDLKFKFRNLSQDMTEKQNQFYQALQNAQMKIMAKIAEYVTTASNKVAKEKSLDAVFNQDATFFLQDSLNISSDVIKEMDVQLDKEVKDQPIQVK